MAQLEKTLLDELKEFGTGETIKPGDVLFVDYVSDTGFSETRAMRLFVTFAKEHGCTVIKKVYNPDSGRYHTVMRRNKKT